jgi:rhodanese-related sulfurtransferase
MLLRRAILIQGAAMCSPFFVSLALAQSQVSMEVVSLEEARRLHEAGQAVLIDIREPQEHATGIAAGAKLLPMSQIGKRLSEIPTDPTKPVLLICNTQNRSSSTLRALRAQISAEKYAHVRYVNGGMSDWAKRGWPMVPPAKP